MWLKMKSQGLPFKISIPVPLGLALFIFRRIPEEKLHLEDSPVSKQWITDMMYDLKHDLKEFKGLTLVEIDCQDGTYVKITV